jgi:hypothetical protein
MAKPKQSAQRPPAPRAGQAKATPARAKGGPAPAKGTPVPAKAVRPQSSLPKAQPLLAPEPEPMPNTVRNAVRLMYAGAIFSAIDLIVSLVTAGQISTAIQNANPHWSHARVTANAHAELTASVVIWLVTIGLWVIMARTNQAGRNWARIVATALSVLSTLSFAEAVIQPAALVSKLVYLPLWAVGVAAVILLWRPATTDYIRAGRA